MIRNILGGFIVILIGASLVPEINAYSRHHKATVIIEKKEREHRQTYEEYVRERINVERMMGLR